VPAAARRSRAPDTEAFPYRYDPSARRAVCKMIELLPHIKGRWKTKTITLEPWQIFGQMTLFSWVCAAAQRRDAREGRAPPVPDDYEEVPRKNAKSTDLRRRRALHARARRRAGRRVLLRRDDARPGEDRLGVARAMAKKTPEYCRALRRRRARAFALAPDTESFFKALSAEDDSLDGLNPHFASVDELHAHKTRGVWDVLETATGSREQSLLSTITTAGSNRAGICYEVRTYLTKILNAVLARHPELCEARGYKLEGGAVDDETFFGIIYTIDDGDDWTDPAPGRRRIRTSASRSSSTTSRDSAGRRSRRRPRSRTSSRSGSTSGSTPTPPGWTCGAGTRAPIRRCRSTTSPARSASSRSTSRAHRHRGEALSVPPRATPRRTRTGARADAHYYAFGRFYVPEDAIEESTIRSTPAGNRPGG
jgi:hypothetical protein